MQTHFLPKSADCPPTALTDTVLPARLVSRSCLMLILHTQSNGKCSHTQYKNSSIKVLIKKLYFCADMVLLSFRSWALNGYVHKTAAEYSCQSFWGAKYISCVFIHSCFMKSITTVLYKQSKSVTAVKSVKLYRTSHMN